MARLAQYCNLNRILLLTIGLWPYQQSKFTRFQFILFYAILSSGVIFQLTPLITLKFTLDLVTKILSSVFFHIMFIIQYNTFGFNIKVVKHLLVELQHIHEKLKDENEIAIVEKCSFVAKRYTIVLMVVGIFAVPILIIGYIWLYITNIDLPMNATKYNIFITEYFIDKKKYFYLIVLHINILIFIGVVIMVAIGTIFITYIEHICGMFKIASFRIEHAMNINTLRNIWLTNNILMAEGIICAVDIHRQAMKLSKHFMSTFEIMIFCFTGCVVACFSLNLFQLFQTASCKNNLIEFFVPFMYVIASIMYMFIANYIGQNIIDHNNGIFITAYNVQWYRSPLPIQKMILFLLQRRTKEFSLNIGRVFDASMEGFAMLVKASISYFTLIHSTR